MSDPCIVCLGILQNLGAAAEEIHHVDFLADKERSSMSTKEQIVQAVKREGHRFDKFCLEITIPGVVLVRERALWQYLQSKSDLDSWVHGKKFVEHVVSLKEALKWSLIEPLETILEAKYDIGSSFRVVLLYSHPKASNELDFLGCGTTGSMKRKWHVSNDNDLGSGFAAVAAVRASTEPGESLAAIQRALASMSTEKFVDAYPCPPSKLSQSCIFSAMCYRTPIYIGGRYLKLSRNISQSRWLVDDERKGDGSVEETIADVVYPQFKADSYKFHAAGREDIDVRMLGSGRPFMLELLNARTLLPNKEISKAQNQINTSKEGWIKVRSLKVVGNDAWNLMLQGEAEKQKQYAAIVWISRFTTKADFDCITNTKDLEIQQKTPVRVLHRRSPLVRSRIIHWMRCEMIEGTQQYFLLHLCTQAGTYIKEFVHGDLGRTHPNIGSLLGCEAEIVQLDVTDIKMDLFD